MTGISLTVVPFLNPIRIKIWVIVDSRFQWSVLTFLDILKWEWQQVRTIIAPPRFIRKFSDGQTSLFLQHETYNMLDSDVENFIALDIFV